jgi:hypothetical protein
MAGTAAALTGTSRMYGDSLAASEIVFQAAFREYIDVGGESGLLSEATGEGIEKSWREMRQMELALDSALESHPGDPFLVEKMLDLRKHQLSLLQQLAGAEQTINRSNAI